jgi:hypothetical protein
VPSQIRAFCEAWPFTSHRLRALRRIDAAAAVAEFAGQLSCHAAVLTTEDGRDLGIVEVRAEDNVWLVRPSTNTIVEGNGVCALRTDRGLRAKLGLSGALDEPIVPRLWVAPPEFFSRTQALGQVLLRVGGPLAPLFGDSPSLGLVHYQAALDEERTRAAMPGDEPGHKLSRCKATFSSRAFAQWQEATGTPRPSSRQ